MNYLSKICLGLLLVFFLQQYSYGQTNDNVMWASFKLKGKIDDKTSFALAPIVRLNDNISEYQNISFDISVKRKYFTDFSAQLLARTWIIPDQKPRQFLWLDLGYDKTLNKMQTGARLRVHYAFDIFDREDGDFLRLKAHLNFLHIKNFKIGVAIEPWYKFTGTTGFQRIRYEPGFNYKFHPKMDFSYTFRREETIDPFPLNNVNMHVVTVSYSL